MNGECPYYQILTRRMRNIKSRSDGQPPDAVILSIPWCSHKHSPMPLRKTGTPDATQQLQCEGNLHKCQIPTGKQAGSI